MKKAVVLSAEDIKAIVENTSGIICTLCQRGFKTTEALLKHNALSALHAVCIFPFPFFHRNLFTFSFPL